MLIRPLTCRIAVVLSFMVCQIQIPVLHPHPICSAVVVQLHETMIHKSIPEQPFAGLLPTPSVHVCVCVCAACMSFEVLRVSVANCRTTTEALWVSLPRSRLQTTTCLPCLRPTSACVLLVSVHIKAALQLVYKVFGVWLEMHLKYCWRNKVWMFLGFFSLHLGTMQLKIDGGYRISTFSKSEAVSSCLHTGGRLRHALRSEIVLLCPFYFLLSFLL